ncbi:MAG: 1-deoxy-D-xylulose-5-phosphate synthase, partial [Acidaminococcaceae bacterium]
NLEGLIDIKERAKNNDKPVLVHVITKKGKGYLPAETNPDKFHGTGAFEIATGEKISVEGAPKTYTEVFGDTLVKLAGNNPNIVAITAAMRDGTGLTKFFEKFPERAFDVGIAEQHAVTMAAGLAANNMRPVVAIYSTFLQRAYDQVLHDVCMQNLPVVFCLDRAGLVGDDGYTHHGIFDYSYLRMMPGMTIMAPKDENELRHMLYTAFDIKGPVAIRYPRGTGLGVACTEELKLLSYSKAEKIKDGNDVCIWAAGSMVASAVDVASRLQTFGYSAAVINMRFIKPLDEEMLIQCANNYKNLVVMEENVLAGGAGTEILEVLNKNDLLHDTRVLNFGIPDILVPHGDKKLLFRDIGLDVTGMTRDITEWLAKENGGSVWRRNV